jgi:hypothetical protein
MKLESKINLLDLKSVIDPTDSVFICCSSFEERSKCIPNNLKQLNFAEVKVFSNTDSIKTIISNALEIKNLFQCKSSIIEIKAHDPLFTANSIARTIRELSESAFRKFVIDITTFTHETLLILLKMLWDQKDNIYELRCLYLGASDYSIGEKRGKKWLSKGCKEIRTVFGYPGQLRPGEPTCLIVLVGFEHERATRMIVEMDPEFLLLGKGTSTTHHAHTEPMKYFHKMVSEMVSTRGNVDEFEFSCSQPDQTANLLRELIEKNPEYNYIVVPLNTKLSTVAVAITAFNIPTLQICYAEPETYNFESYSKPSDQVSIFRLI